MSESVPLLKAKVCMLGAPGVGKTSLVARFVHSIFSEKYLTTIGVKVDKKSLELDGRPLDLVLWDLAGEDEFQRIRSSYLTGAAGYLLIVDGTRGATLDKAIELQQRTAGALDALPFEVVINKSDLADQWQIGTSHLDSLADKHWSVTKTSAKTGDAVEDVFRKLGRRILDRE